MERERQTDTDYAQNPVEFSHCVNRIKPIAGLVAMQLRPMTGSGHVQLQFSLFKKKSLLFTIRLIKFII